MCLLTIHITAPTPARTLNTAQGYARDPPNPRASRWPRRLVARRSAGTRMHQPPGVWMVARRRAWPSATDHPHAAARLRVAPAPPRRALQAWQASGCRPARAAAAGRFASMRRRCVASRARSSRASRSSRVRPRSRPRVVLVPLLRGLPSLRHDATLRENHERCAICKSTVSSASAQMHRLHALDRCRAASARCEGVRWHRGDWHRSIHRRSGRPLLRLADQYVPLQSQLVNFVSRRVGGVPEAVEHGYTSRLRGPGVQRAANQILDWRLSFWLDVDGRGSYADIRD